MLYECEYVIANLILAVLFLAQNGKCGEENAFQMHEQHFVALSVNQIQCFEHVLVFNIILAQWQIRDENWEHILQRNQSTVDEDETAESSADVVQDASVALLRDETGKCFKNSWIVSKKSIISWNMLKKRCLTYLKLTCPQFTTISPIA